MKKKLLKIIISVLVMCLVGCGVLYFFQEKLIFHPGKLSEGFKFSFDGKFEEINIKTQDNLLLNGLLFNADSSKGLIFYLHGNAGNLDSWGGVADAYTGLNYDVFIPDYRGFGKSQGEISSQDQLYQDLQIAYDEMKKRYDENKIIVLGYSIGTGPAAKIASANKPKMLILQAPYYSLTDMMKDAYPMVPTFLLKYKFETHVFVKNCKAPVVIFHGDQDEIIPHSASVKLKGAFKNTDTLIILSGLGHNGMTDDPEYRTGIKRILN